MKKILSLAFLAIIPVACGSVVPTAPDVPTSATAPKASATVSASVDPFQPMCPLDSRVVGLDLKVIRRASQGITVRAEPLMVRGDDGTPPCVVPIWSVKPLARGVRITPGTDRQEATLEAPSGSYVITAFAENGSKAGLSASLEVTVR